MVKYICNCCKGFPCTITMSNDLLFNHKLCFVDVNNTAQFIKHIPDPVRMILGKPEFDCDSGDMPCYLKAPNRKYCVRSGEDCEIIHDTINRYGVIVGIVRYSTPIVK